MRGLEKKQKREYAWAIAFMVVFVCYGLILLPLLPFADDWHYHTKPNLYFRWSSLLPRAVVWRPLDILFGGFLGLSPAMFPWVNRLVGVAGHVVGGYGTFANQ